MDFPASAFVTRWIGFGQGLQYTCINKNLILTNMDIQKEASEARMDERRMKIIKYLLYALFVAVLAIILTVLI